MKIRKCIPTAIREKVLKEYHHLCAICGRVSPQLHHIDENPDNNGLLNLLPLCPNCHLGDHHNPTAKIDRGILMLFRTHKDPAILAPEFEPLYRRLSFLNDLQALDGRTYETQTRMDDLTAFIRVLNMGDFYADQIKALSEHGHRFRTNRMSACQIDKMVVKRCEEVRSKVFALCIEMIRYQAWPVPRDSPHQERVGKLQPR